MKKSLPLLSLLAGTVLLTNPLSAQQPDRFAYSMTDVALQGSNWSFLRKLDLRTGQYSAVLLNGNDVSLPAYDAASKKQFTAPVTDALYGTAANAAFATGVAAMAYDKKNDRLYYTPMFIDQLRYIDLRSMKVFFVADQVLTAMPQKSPDQGNIITRMVIASDGNGYAMTNDGMHLMQFTTGKKTRITDMGSLVDAPSNNAVSIHNSCSSFGGDIVADDNNNLYVFSARNHVFKVNLESRVATHIGVISGLSNNFTVNGAAVSENNQVVVSSAMDASSYFSVDMKSLAAVPYSIAGTVWHSSDLANSNLLVSGNRAEAKNIELMTNKIPANIADSKVNVYPNPVLNNQFVVQFNQLEAGSYTLQVTDVTGRQAFQQPVTVGGENQSQLVRLNPSSAKGIYLVKVLDQNNKAVYSTMLVVQ
ncbi:MAG: T9SS type A sorting domain-containing protein [Chitinophagaceae bacterium]